MIKEAAAPKVRKKSASLGRPHSRGWRMPSWTATKGRSYEHEVRQLFEAAGYSVIRGAGSKGMCLEEKTDLVCTKETAQNQFKAYLTIVVVQCKVKRR